MNTEILKILKDLRSDLFYQIESKFGAEKASKYPSIVDADSLINKLTICGVSCSCADKEEKAFGKGYNLGAKEASDEILSKI